MDSLTTVRICTGIRLVQMDFMYPLSGRVQGNPSKLYASPKHMQSGRMILLKFATKRKANERQIGASTTLKRGQYCRIWFAIPG